MNRTERKWFLRQPKHFKLDCLRSAMAESLGDFIALGNILLDASISEGGISSEEIDQIKIVKLQSFVPKIEI
ncbi:MAG: hypothetical protein HOH13_04515 [Crocinitomicaceae bacterium]|jgi:hypothetical protein|nr:hypothetical protein [Crocinitomicaceae bacterium]MBT5404228.1 hypothetical protein [Crocinitomicaceae bacterium]MBT6029544.1 hypothetical protein [Crocinitomicaceae bacterium]MBT6515533.1 hypothetical protein [Crocinitomicaceae bacterium]